MFTFLLLPLPRLLLIPALVPTYPSLSSCIKRSLERKIAKKFIELAVRLVQSTARLLASVERNIGAISPNVGLHYLLHIVYKDNKTLFFEIINNRLAVKQQDFSKEVLF